MGLLLFDYADYVPVNDYFCSMIKVDQNSTNPIENEPPVSYANRLGELYTSTVSNGFKKEQGQFFTPLEIAQFMSHNIVAEKESISILDPGCGTAILSCALIEEIITNYPIKTIELIAYEIDYNLIPFTEKSLAYLNLFLAQKNIDLNYTIRTSDFVLDNYLALDNNSKMLEIVSKKFDFIISNPPYFKLSKEDKRVKAVQSIIDGQPNIYSIFMAISAALLNDSGEMIFIIPRSFTSGRYFRLFRNYLLGKVKIDFIHLFNTRKDTFSKDNVLQETLIIKCVNIISEDINNLVTISYSEGIKDLEAATLKEHRQSDLIKMNSVEKIIHLPVNAKDEKIINLFKSWDGSLNKYEIQISTGPVVAFRMESSLSENSGENMAPLFWLNNVIKMLADHPIVKAGKKQFIEISDITRSSLLPNKNYIFLRRFSAKDDNSRLIAAPYFCNTSKAEFIGVENKLNYIYRPKGHLARTEVIGISALLDSDLFDNYFRTFNGNVNVSATELREMPMPPLETIKAIGEKLILKNNFSLENINKIVNDFFKI